MRRESAGHGVQVPPNPHECGPHKSSPGALPASTTPALGPQRGAGPCLAAPQMAPGPALLWPQPLWL